jgi:hypothetical protein
VGDERAVDPASAPGRQRKAAPERRELRTRGKSHPAVGDGATACFRHEDAEALRVGGALVGESIDPAVVFVRHRLIKLHEPREVAWLAQLADDHSVRQARLAGNHLCPADYYGLRVFGLKTSRAQAVGQVGRAIVPVQLPLEGLAARREDLHLPRDQRVEFVAVEAGEVAVLDEAAIAEAERSHKWPIALYADGIRKPVVHVPAQLRVVGRQ